MSRLRRRVAVFVVVGAGACVAPAPPLVTHPVEVAAGAGGVVGVLFDDPDSGDTVDLDCDPAAACNFDVVDEGVVSLVARADAGQRFAAWSGDCAEETAAVIEAVVTHPLSCRAAFEPVPVPVDEGPLLTLDVLGPGALVSAPVGLDCHGVDVDRAACAGHFAVGTTVEVTATVDDGADFIGFTGDCQDAAVGDTTTLVLDHDATCGAIFLESGTGFPLRVEVEGSGSIRSDVGGIDCGDGNDACSAVYADGTVVILTAVGAEGATFQEWGHGCAGVAGPAVQITMAQAFACSAVFARSFSIVVEGDGVVTTDAGDSCGDGFLGTCSVEGVPSSLTATPDPGQRFVGWSGDCAGTDATVALDGDEQRCTARFAPPPPALTVVVVGDGRVTADGADPVDCGVLGGDCSSEPVGVPGAVDPGPGVWSCDLTAFGTDDGCDCGCGVPDPDCFSANRIFCGFPSFEPLEGSCAADLDDLATDQNHLCVLPDVIPIEVTLVAAPADGQAFVGWRGDCAGSAATLPVTTTTSRTCAAVFSPVGCGDGAVVDPEACDDGDHDDGDGCAFDCAVEAGFVCDAAPSVCVAGP
jgi:cysteine-rich repeat protein